MGKITFRESEDSIFKDYGIESNHDIPGHDGKYFVANTIRALLDLLDEGDFSNAQGMNEDFMGKEYLMKWLRFKKDNELMY